MRKNVLAIISFLAVAANLIVPGLAFGQSQQSGTQQVNCGYLTLNAYPANDLAFSFSPASISTGTQYTYGNQFTSSSDPYQNGTDTLPAQAFVYIEDLRTGGTCGNSQFLLTVQASDFTGPTTISANNLRAVTTRNVTPWGQTDVQGTMQDIVWTQQAAINPSYLYWRSQNMEYADVLGAWISAADDANLTSASTFDISFNELGAPVHLIQNDNSTSYIIGEVGVGIAYRLGVPANTPAGTYTTTLTYTLVTY